MSTLSLALRDSTTMARREMRHALRFPMMTISAVMVPVFLLLLFVGVFGDTLRAGLGSGIALGKHYIDYLAPGILLVTAASGAEGTAVNTCAEMTEGIISRFRTMAVSPTSVLAGQVAGSVVRAVISAALVLVVAWGAGFRPAASPAQWLAAAGLFLLIAVALTWVGVAFGLVAKTPAGANSLALTMIVLPFVSSAFVPTRSMPTGVRWFATNQPFTPIIQTVRGLFNGTPSGHDAILAVVWSLVIGAAGYLGAMARFGQMPAR